MCTFASLGQAPAYLTSIFQKKIDLYIHVIMSRSQGLSEPLWSPQDRRAMSNGMDQKPLLALVVTCSSEESGALPHVLIAPPPSRKQSWMNY